MSRLALLALTIFVLLYTHIASAIVDMKSANYAETWYTLTAPSPTGGFEMQVRHTYSSRSLFNGMFGYGWCSPFESSLTVTAEGNLKFRECGAGAEVTFSPQAQNPKDVKATVARILTELKTRQKGLKEDFLKELEVKLLDYDNLRTEYAEKLGINVKLKAGTVYKANGQQDERIVLEKNVFVYYQPGGALQKFDSEGHLVQIYDRNGNFLKLVYKNDRVMEVVDNNGRKLSFDYTSNGKVKEVRGPGGLVAKYQYSNLVDLAELVTAENVKYNFKYDEQHNLIKIGYPKGKTKEISYNKQEDWVTGFKDLEGCHEKYNYEVDPKDKLNHFWATVTKTCGKEVTNNSRYEFWYKQRTDGTGSYLHRALTENNNRVQDITYHPIFGRPTRIMENGIAVSFTYYDTGLVKSKADRLQRMDFFYQKPLSKVAKVVTTLFNDKGKKVRARSTEFKYDPRGNLIFAQNTDGQFVHLNYDGKGRIEVIKDQAKKIVRIKYDDKFGKPAYVDRPGLGAISVSYKKNGELDKVVSPQGPTVAIQVASTFNNLLDIIAPASPELSL